MNEKDHGLHLVKQPGWRGRFIECQLRELAGEKLSLEDAEFTAAIIAAGGVMPGLLEEALLEHGLTAAAARLQPGAGEAAASEEDAVADDAALTWAVVRYGIAAASPKPVYQQIINAIEAGQEMVSFDIAGEAVSLLQIVSSDWTVKPCFQENYTFIIEREGDESLEVTPYGGIFLSLEETRQMLLHYSESDHTIRLYHG